MTIRMDNHGHERLTRGFWMGAVSMLILFVAACFYVGMDDVFREEINYRSGTMMDVAAEAARDEIERQRRFEELWARCVEGDRIIVTRPGCPVLARYVTAEANKADREVGYAE